MKKVQAKGEVKNLRGIVIGLFNSYCISYTIYRAIPAQYGPPYT